jgi:hypothetical protein
MTDELIATLRRAYPLPSALLLLRRHSLASCLARLPERGSLASLLESSTPELKTITAALLSAQGGGGGGGGGGDLRVLRGYSIFSKSRLRLFRDRVGQHAPAAPAPAGHTAAGSSSDGVSE